jgi:hypothetical protein
VGVGGFLPRRRVAGGSPRGRGSHRTAGGHAEMARLAEPTAMAA